MAVCALCGNQFEEKDAKTEFERLTWRLHYEKLRRPLCGSCAVHAIERRKEGLYFETCGKCGKTFDLAVDERDFEHTFQWDHSKTLRDCWGKQVLCCDCAAAGLYNRS